MGPRTRAAESAARAYQKERGKSFIHSSGITRIHWHWTGGGYKANDIDLKSYHLLIEGDGKVLRPHRDSAVLAHTLNSNTGAMGLSCCAMRGAQEVPFRPGDAPLTMKQIHALAVETAKLCELYDIPVSPWSTLSHAEVQPSLGVAQRQKWDISWLPGMEKPADPISVGNRIRDLVRLQLKNP